MLPEESVVSAGRVTHGGQRKAQRESGKTDITANDTRNRAEKDRGGLEEDMDTL